MNASGSDSAPSTLPALARSREFTCGLLDRLTLSIDACEAIRSSNIICLSVAGSLGRLEAGLGSDFDGVAICADPAGVGAASTREALVRLGEIVTAHGLRLPKTDGIYLRPIARSDLLDPQARGSLSESPLLFGSRMQFLLDGRAVYGGATFEQLREDVLGWYSSDADAPSHWTHLINDVVRYLHAYAVWQQHKFNVDANDAWYLRQAKFRTTRVVTFASLLFVLAESTRAHADARRWVQSQLALTPFARIEAVFGRYSDRGFPAFARAYDTIHALLSDPEVRAALVRLSPRDQSEIPATLPEPYAQLHRCSAVVMDVLTEFILRRQHDWPRGIFRNWLL